VVAGCRLLSSSSGSGQDLIFSHTRGGNLRSWILQVRQEEQEAKGSSGGEEGETLRLGGKGEKEGPISVDVWKLCLVECHLWSLHGFSE